MKETFYLNQKILPTIPVPHDCIIKELHLEDDYLILIFEDNISHHDSINSIRPNAKSLVIKMHFVDDVNDLQLFIREKPDFVLHKAGAYNEYDLLEDGKNLSLLTNNKLEYLYHNVGFCSIIIKMWSSGSIIFDIASDYIEYEWIE